MTCACQNWQIVFKKWTLLIFALLMILPVFQMQIFHLLKLSSFHWCHSIFKKKEKVGMAYCFEKKNFDVGCSRERTHISHQAFFCYSIFILLLKKFRQCWRNMLVGWQRLLYFKHRTDSNNEYDISFDSGNISNTFALSMFAGYQSNDDHYSLGHKILLQCKYFKVHWLQI